MKNIFRVAAKKIEEIRARGEKKSKKNTRTFRKKIAKVKKHEIIELEISSKTIVKILLIFAVFSAAVHVFSQLQNILITAAIAFFIALALAPIVDGIERHHIPRPLAILLLYLAFFGILAILFVQIIPILAEQLLDIAYDIRSFFANSNQSNIPFLDEIFAQIQFNPDEIQQFATENLAQISEKLQSVAGSTFEILAGVFQGVFNFIFALVVIFLILMERESIANFLIILFPQKDREYIVEKVRTVQSKMSKWFRGQMILMISVGLAMYLGVKILEFSFDMKYAATIGLLAGFMELFPYIGVFITGVLSVLIALNISWILVFAVVIWIAIVQFLEGNILVPLVMEKVVGLSSVVVILSLAIGGTLGNAAGGVPLAILGMIFAVPVAASIAIFVEEYAKKEK